MLAVLLAIGVFCRVAEAAFVSLRLRSFVWCDPLCSSRSRKIFGRSFSRARVHHACICSHVLCVLIRRDAFVILRSLTTLRGFSPFFSLLLQAKPAARLVQRSKTQPAIKSPERASKDAQKKEALGFVVPTTGSNLFLSFFLFSFFSPVAESVMEQKLAALERENAALRQQVNAQEGDLLEPVSDRDIFDATGLIALPSDDEPSDQWLYVSPRRPPSAAQRRVAPMVKTEKEKKRKKEKKSVVHLFFFPPNPSGVDEQ
jgi:hypothetical protein